MLLLFLACAKQESCQTDLKSGVSYSNYGCYDDGGKPAPPDTPDECAGFGFVRSGPLYQFCVECGSIVCVYKVRGSETLGGIEMEIRAPIPTDEGWVEYHDAFSVSESVDGKFRMDLPLTITDDPTIWESNTNTLFNLRDEATMAEVDMELSVMLPDGTYPECVIWGNHPDKFADSCEEVAGP